MEVRRGLVLWGNEFSRVWPELHWSTRRGACWLWSRAWCRCIWSKWECCDAGYRCGRVAGARAGGHLKLAGVAGRSGGRGQAEVFLSCWGRAGCSLVRVVHSFCESSVALEASTKEWVPV